MSEYLSNTELYYTKPENFRKGNVFLEGDEFNHITKVMRHSIGDNIYVTNGIGEIFLSGIITIDKRKISLNTLKKIKYKNRFKNIILCIPNLRKPQRLEFAIEKATELGITNFIIFSSKRTAKKNVNLVRLNKIALSAMKQSLNSFLPKIIIQKDLTFLELVKDNIILFEQNIKEQFNNTSIAHNKTSILLFGPEGGFDDNELSENMNIKKFNLAPNRLRSETAIIKAVSILT